MTAVTTAEVSRLTEEVRTTSSMLDRRPGDGEESLENGNPGSNRCGACWFQKPTLKRSMILAIWIHAQQSLSHKPLSFFRMAGIGNSKRPQEAKKAKYGDRAALRDDGLSLASNGSDLHTLTFVRPGAILELSSWVLRLVEIESSR